MNASGAVALSTTAQRVLDVLRTRPGAVPGSIALLESDLDEDGYARELRVLRDLGYEIAALPDGSFQLLRVPDRLLPHEIKRQLDTLWLGHDLRCFDGVDSTNSVARDAARAGAEEGMVVLAEAQTRGRGRLGRTWISPPRCNLYLSAVLRPSIAAADLPGVTLTAGVAVCDAAREWDPRAMIKWPNDILVDGRKVAGLLAEAEGDGEGRFLVLGIGVNLNAGSGDFPPELARHATSLRLSTGRPVDRARFTARLLHHLEHRLDVFVNGGFTSIAPAWQERSCLTGCRIRVDGVDGTVVGVVRGLDSDGALRLLDEAGSERRVIAGDVTVRPGFGQRSGNAAAE